MLAQGIVPNQSDAYAPKIGLHMQWKGAISGGDGHGCGVGCFPPAGLESILTPLYVVGLNI